MDPALKGVVWTCTAKETHRDRTPLAGDLEIDLAVVGGGYCGLAAALHAATAGISVAVVESGIVGGGASSGRNGGFVVPHFPGAITPSCVSALIGAKKGAALCELVAGGPDAVMGQIARYQIACDAQQNGWIQPTHSPKALAETCGLDELPLATTDGVHRIAWQRVKTAAARVVFPVYQGIDRIGLS
jgi:glycine/D-amino acid oxidase-like deaminating enzyme